MSKLEHNGVSSAPLDHMARIDKIDAAEPQLLKAEIDNHGEQAGVVMAESRDACIFDKQLDDLSRQIEAMHKSAEQFKTARMIATNHLIHRYLMSNADGRWDGAEKAMRHEELCTYYVGLHLGITDLDLVRGRRAEVGECLFQAVHTATQELTGYLDERIGFPLSGRPDYDTLAPLFFEQFDELALKALETNEGDM